MAESFLWAIVSESLRGVPLLFRRSLPEKVRIPRLVGLLSPVFGVFSWSVARMLHLNIQNEIAELAFGVAGWILFLLFVVAT